MSASLFLEVGSDRDFLGNMVFTHGSCHSELLWTQVSGSLSQQSQGPRPLLTLKSNSPC
jgi:hypothetical protein